MGCLLSIVVHVFTRINGVEGVSGGYKGVGLSCSFEVVCIGSETMAPSFLKDSPQGVVHHLLGRAARSLVLAHRLLRKNRRHACLANGPDMARCGETEAITTSGRLLQADRCRPPETGGSCATMQRCGMWWLPFVT